MHVLAALLALLQDPQFPPTHIIAGSSPEELCAGDINGDGDQDLLVTLSTGAMSVLLNAGQGSFDPPISVAMGNGAGRSVLADLNGDGDLDMAVAVGEVGIDLVVTRLGNGDGTFGNKKFTTIPLQPTDLHVALVNNDQIPDLVVTCATQPRLSVLLGVGNGTFSVVSSPVSQVCWSGAVGRVDGDEHLDVLVGTDNGLRLMLGDGEGGFQAGLSVALGHIVTDVELGDFDADGNLDAAAGTSVGAGLRVLFGAGDGTFGAPIPHMGLSQTPSLIVADLDEDGDDDVAALSKESMSLGVLSSLGNGSFAPLARYGTATPPFDLLVADLSSDGDLDLLTSTSGFFFYQTLTLLPGRGDGTFGPLYAAGDGCSDIDFGDLDLDGTPDMVVSNAFSDNLTVFPGVGNGFFGTGANVPAGDVPSSLVLAHLDGDAFLDAAVSNGGAPSGLSILFGRGDLSFDPVVLLPVAGQPKDVAAADLDGDLDLDLAAVCSANNTLALLANLGGRVFGAPDLSSTGANPTSLVCERLDAGSTVDIAVSTETSPALVHVYLGNGDASVQSPLTFVVGGVQKDIAAADVDGDTDIDLVTVNSNSNTVSVLDNVGGGFFDAPLTYSTGDWGPLGLVLADIDRDGKLDVATSNDSPVVQIGVDSVSVLPGDGLGAFGPPQTYLASPLLGTLVAYDINGDGAPDLATPTLYDQVDLRINQRGPWQDLGFAKAGSLGLPKQVGEGTLEGLAPYRFTLTDARPNSIVAHIVGLSAVYAPFKGGTLVPFPDLINTPLSTDGNGELVLEGPWLEGAGGLTLYLQFWLVDLDGPTKFAASNALSAEIP